MNSKRTFDPDNPDNTRYLREPAMAPRHRVVTMVLALVAGFHIWDVFNRRVRHAGFSVKEHLWGGSFISGFAVGLIGFIFPVMLFMIWWTGTLKWMRHEQKYGLTITGFVLIACGFAADAIIYWHDFKHVWHDAEQWQGFRQGTLAAIVLVALFMAVFGLITGRMTKPWHNRAYNHHMNTKAENRTVLSSSRQSRPGVYDDDEFENDFEGRTSSV